MFDFRVNISVHVVHGDFALEIKRNIVIVISWIFIRIHTKNIKWILNTYKLNEYSFKDIIFAVSDRPI